MTAAPRHRRHFTRRPSRSSSAARDHRPDLDHVVFGQALVTRRQRVVADHEHRLGNDVEGAEQLLHGPGRWELELALRVAEQDLHGRSRVPAETDAAAYSASLAPKTKMSPGCTRVRYSTSGSLWAMRYNARSPIARMPTIIHVREPPRPRRSEWSVMRRSAPRYTSDPPDLEHGLAALPAPPAEPVRGDDRGDGHCDRDHGHRELHVAD